MKRVFFGGTFDPIHVGHTRLALECQQQLAAPLTFVPCGDPPHKELTFASASQRLAMVNLAVDELNETVGAQKFFVERMEIDHDQPSFTVTTLENLRRQHPNDSLFWLIGMDSLVHLASWHRWQELVTFANLLVVNRPGWSLPHEGVVADWLRDRFIEQDKVAHCGGVVILPTTLLDLASTSLRQQLRQPDLGKFLLPESVRQFVAEQGLYHHVN
jgi:nicotinate-nucleotide adenylyltransferase